MQDLKVTLVQADQIWENKLANFENYTRMLHNCEETDLIILPEMFDTGFSMNASTIAEEYDNNSSVDWLKELARDKESAIYTSLMVKENGKFYNRGVFVQPSGEVHRYDKRKLFSMAGEDKVYTLGKQPNIVNYKGWKINLQICYDLRFPEISLNVEENGSPQFDVSIYIANWPEKRIYHWNSLLIARSIENQCYVIGVNRIGKDGNNLNYSGASQVVSPLGEVDSMFDSDGYKTISLSEHALMETRKNLPFLKDRF